MAGLLDVDQIIEDTAALNRVSIDMDLTATRWGVKVELVRVQRVDALTLTQVLAKKKNADLLNKEVIIKAKMDKQTKIIESEGPCDRQLRFRTGLRFRSLAAVAPAHAVALLASCGHPAPAARDGATAVPVRVHAAPLRPACIPSHPANRVPLCSATTCDATHRTRRRGAGPHAARFAGQRDRMVKEAEGEAQRMVSQARGQAQAIRNKSTADAKSVVEIARAVASAGENPTKYLLAMKYIEALDAILSKKNTQVDFMPMETAFLQTVSSEFGLNTILPRAGAAQ